MEGVPVGFFAGIWVGSEASLPRLLDAEAVKSKWARD